MDAQQVRNHFRVQVSDYPNLMKRLIPFYDEQREMMLRLIPFDRSHSLRVLDLGCGPGLMAAQILSAYPSASLTAFDLTAEMLEACRSRLGKNPSVTYQVGDFRNGAFGSDYDLIVASLSLHHLTLSERPGFFKRALDSLRPGGVLISAEVIVDEDAEVRQQQYALWRRFMSENGEDEAYWYGRHLEKDHPATISGLLEMLEAAGFRRAGCFWRFINFAIVSGEKTVQ